MDRQDEYTKAQLSLSQDFSDHNLSLMMKEHDIERLCSVTCSVTGEYLTEDEQVKFFTCLLPSMIPISIIIKNQLSTKSQSIRY